MTSWLMPLARKPNLAGSCAAAGSNAGGSDAGGSDAVGSADGSAEADADADGDAATSAEGLADPPAPGTMDAAAMLGAAAAIDGAGDWPELPQATATSTVASAPA